MTKAPWMILPLALGLGVLSCQPLTPLHQTVVTQVPAVQGQVSDLLPTRSVAAQIPDVANGATVSLIDTLTGVTVATTVTAANGSFTLNFGSDFKPVTGKPYYLEAVKGLGVGGSPNRAGAAIARVRTLLFYNWNGWSSLSGGVGFPVSIGKATTTVAAIVSLKGLSTASQSALVGTISGTTFTDPSNTIFSLDFSTVFALIDAAVTADQDPLEALTFDSSGATPAAQFVLKPGNLVIHDNYSVNGSPSPATASLNAPYNTITFYGQNFPSSASVTIGTVPVATWSVNARRTQLTATLASNGYSGGLQITQGTSTWTGPFVPVSGTVGTIAGNGNAGYCDSMGTIAQISRPVGMASDANGNLYVTEMNSHRIRKIVPDGSVTTLAGSGVAGFLDGAGTAAQISNPFGLEVDANGTVYVAEYGNHTIRKITPTGIVSTLAGSPSVGGFADGTGTAAQFLLPCGLAVDGSGNLYVGDYGNQRIRKITSAGVVTTIAGNGTNASIDGTGTGASFMSPRGVALDGLGNLYVAEYGAHKIRRVVLATGVVSTIAGSGVAGFADGTGTAAQFNYPHDILLDQSGNFYVSDIYTQRIRKVTPAGVVTTLAGSGTTGFMDGSALSAQFSNPHGIALSNGSLFIADWKGNRIRAFTP